MRRAYDVHPFASPTTMRVTMPVTSANLPTDAASQMT